MKKFIANWLWPEIQALLSQTKSEAGPSMEDAKEKLVHTISFGIDISPPNGVKKTGKFYYYLFEDQKGKRRVSYGCVGATDKTIIDIYAKNFEDYHETVFPWLHGRYVKGIPSYNDVDSVDVQNKLSEP